MFHHHGKCWICFPPHCSAAAFSFWALWLCLALVDSEGTLIASIITAICHSSVSVTDRLRTPRQGLPSPNSHAHLFKQYILLPFQPDQTSRKHLRSSVWEFAALQVTELVWDGLCRVVAMLWRNKDIKGTRPSTLKMGPT